MLAAIAAILIAFSIGSNDTSNSFGISIGCGMLTFRRAVLLLGIFVTLGALTQRSVMETVGGLAELDGVLLSVSLLVSALMIILSNWKKLPVSSHQAIIGSLVGAGLAAGSAKLGVLTSIVLSWLISPVSSLIFAVLLYSLMERTLSRLPVFVIERILSLLLLVSGAVIAYNTGANELATALGPIVSAGLMSPNEAAIVGSLALIMGAVLLSGRVVETVGKGITSLDAFSGFAAQMAAGISVLTFTNLGMPVSTTYCIIGGIAGVGMLKGVSSVRLSLIKKILASWVITPISAFTICFAIGRLLTL
ncbi:inorganic phosphate transporter [Archaeoglobus veneficus]|uniref:Phosphate transporter n=1 Tax=Archaeoglobus veneficus (strain DSM 11195 / SNP6) TaxID=693661 RepID=F2KND8_ARCVS|nr:inorganic phosphate transporter [Archaeoglobus veneficus]AEA47340.1 phosphate transporter [Archaeoglobus veneficus SNP6]